MNTDVIMSLAGDNPHASMLTSPTSAAASRSLSASSSSSSSSSSLSAASNNPARDNAADADNDDYGDIGVEMILRRLRTRVKALSSNHSELSEKLQSMRADVQSLRRSLSEADAAAAAATAVGEEHHMRANTAIAEAEELR
jgi:two-component sensor histidine kinase